MITRFTSAEVRGCIYKRRKITRLKTELKDRNLFLIVQKIQLQGGLILKKKKREMKRQGKRNE